MSQSKAIEVPKALVIQAAMWNQGHLVLEVHCHDYVCYRALPEVVVYQGVTCGKTGWSSDRHYACYQSRAHIAYTSHTER
jgi:hypothetical protein